MAIRGTVSTSDETSSRVPDIYELTLLEKSAARFLRVLTKLRDDVRTLHSPEYKTQERRPRSRTTTTSSSALAADTTINVASSALFSPNNLALNPRTGEMVLVRDCPTSTTILVDRGLENSGTGTAMNNGDTLIRLVRAEAEGYTVGESYITDTSQTTNYIFTHSTPVEWSNYQMENWSYLSKGQQSSRLAPDQEAEAINHLRDLDIALLVSKKSKTAQAKGYRYTTQGLIPTIVTNVYDHTGGTQITEAQYNTNVLANAYVNDSSEKWAFTANKCLTVMEGFQRDKVYYEPGEEQTMGFAVSRYKKTRGTLAVIHHPGLDDMGSYYNESQVICDFKHLRLAVWKDTKYRKELQNKKDNVRLDEWQTSVGLDVQYEEAHVFSRDWVTAA